LIHLHSKFQSLAPPGKKIKRHIRMYSVHPKLLEQNAAYETQIPFGDSREALRGTSICH